MMTRKVQKGPRARIAHHFKPLAATKSARPARNHFGEGLPRTACSTTIPRNVAGYATRMIPYTSWGASIPPRLSWALSFDAALHASRSIGTKTRARTAGVNTANGLRTRGSIPPMNHEEHKDQGLRCRRSESLERARSVGHDERRTRRSLHLLDRRVGGDLTQDEARGCDVDHCHFGHDQVDHL